MTTSKQSIRTGRDLVLICVKCIFNFAHTVGCSIHVIHVITMHVKEENTSQKLLIIYKKKT